MAENGRNTNQVLLVLFSILIGIVISGAGMVVRGDLLGKEAAQEVEQRVNRRMDRELGYIKAQLQRIEDKLD